MEHWFSKAGCVKMKASAIKKMQEESDEDANSSDDD